MFLAKVSYKIKDCLGRYFRKVRMMFLQPVVHLGSRCVREFFKFTKYKRFKGCEFACPFRGVVNKYFIFLFSHMKVFLDRPPIHSCIFGNTCNGMTLSGKSVNFVISHKLVPIIIHKIAWFREPANLGFGACPET